MKEMEKILNQQEIDAIVRAARSGGAAAPKRQDVSVAPWDYRQVGRMGGEHLESISALHESFVRNLTNSLGAYLRTAFQAGLASAEDLSYREFLAGIPERSYLGSVKLEPVGASALIQMDMAIAFLLIDVLLGGEGVGPPPAREVTDIEEQILETVMRLICRELQNVWQPLGIQFEFEQRQQPGRIQHLMPVEEKTLGLSFELTLKETRGLMSIAVPAVVSGALLRQISLLRPRAQAQMGSIEFTKRVRRKLLTCPFRLDLQLEGLSCSAKELASLSPGSVLALRQRADGLARLVCEERAVFSARIARVAHRRAAQVANFAAISSGDEANDSR